MQKFFYAIVPDIVCTFAGGSAARLKYGKTTAAKSRKAGLPFVHKKTGN